MPSFDFLPLLWWGLPLALAPVIIHLINLLRHRKVPWAAMEFLISSQKKYRTRVLLRQLLLLLLRVAAIVGIALLFAQPRWRSAVGAFLGGSRTAHIVLLDDSYSMSDRVGESTAFDRGRGVIERILEELVSSRHSHELLVGRFSTISSTGSATPEDLERKETTRWDVTRQMVSPQSVQAIRNEIKSLVVSQSAATPREAILAATEMIGFGSGTSNVLWLITDFRSKDWKVADETAAALRQLSDQGVDLRLVDCAQGDHGNLTIERLDVVGGVSAKGVLVPLEVTVRNSSDRPVRNVSIDFKEDGAARPSVRLEEIPARGISSQRLESIFSTSGSHLISARLENDAVAIDNTRSTVIEIADYVDVLLIDGDPNGGSRTGDAFFVAAALAPGSGVATGLRPRIEPPRALGELDLKTFDAIWLMDVERLDEAEVAAIERYARSGGGVVFFLGPRSNATTINQLLYRNGDGLFPVPLAGPVDMLVDSVEKSPDVIVQDHPVVAVLSGQRNPLLGGVSINRYMAVERGYIAPTGSGLRRLLELRGGAPLAVERPYGEGLVVAFLSTASPTWNNWARGNPSWVVVMLELESHLTHVSRKALSLEVGDRLEVKLIPGTDESEVDFLLPPDGAVLRVAGTIDAAGSMTAEIEAATIAGPYAARWQRTDGSEAEKLFSVNVVPEEGDIERIGRERLDRTLSGVKFSLEKAAELRPDSESFAGISLVTPFLYGLIVVLLLEQFVAYLCSYHSLSRSNRIG